MRRSSVLLKESGTRMLARCSRIPSRWELHQLPTTRTWVAGHHHQHHQSSRLANHRRKTNLNKHTNHHREGSTQKIHTGREHVGHRRHEGRCLQAHSHWTPIRTSRHPRFPHIKAALLIRDPHQADPTPFRQRPPLLCSRHLLLWRKHHSRPNPHLLQTNFTWTHRKRCRPPKRLHRYSHRRHSHGHKLLLRSHKDRSHSHMDPRPLFPNLRDHRALSHTLQSQRLLYGPDRISA
jgi:hypothetical protein